MHRGLRSGDTVRSLLINYRPILMDPEPPPLPSEADAGAEMVCVPT